MGALSPAAQRQLALATDVLDSDALANAVDRFRDQGIVLPTFAQLADPSTIPADALARLDLVDPGAGDAANLSIAMQPGGCYCERWAGGVVEHGRVILLLRDQAVRLDAALGPLQGLAVSAVLTFALKPEDGGTALSVGYRVNGSASSALDKLSGAVDGVIGTQVQRLKRLVETGKPGP